MTSENSLDDLSNAVQELVDEFLRANDSGGIITGMQVVVSYLEPQGDSEGYTSYMTFGLPRQAHHVSLGLAHHQIDWLSNPFKLAEGDEDED